MKNMADVIFAEQTVSGFAYVSDYGAYHVAVGPAPFILEENKTYKVSWDGTEYEETAFIFNDGTKDLVVIGNKAATGGDNTGQPFAMMYSSTTDFVNFFALTTEESHTIAIALMDEDTENVGETTGVSITLYNRTGVATTYDNVETITTDTPDAEKRATFTYGVAVENAEYELNMADGDQKVTLDKGDLLKEFTLKKPENLTPEYIKKGIDVAGVVGEFAGDEREKTVDLNMADGDQVIEADEDTVLTKVTVTKPETLLPENITKGIEIAGVVGTKAAINHGIIDGTSKAEIYDDLFDSPPTLVSPYAFYVNKGIGLVTLRSVSEIAANGFYGCGITYANFPACKTIGSSAFQSCTNLALAYFDACEIIHSRAFSNCTKLWHADFPACKTIGSCAFASCSAISYASFPVCEMIYDYAFSRTSSLTQAYFPNCLEVKNVAFHYCRGLSVVNLEKCVSLGRNAFLGCSVLNEMILPECSSMGASVFYDCVKMSRIYIPKLSVLPTQTFYRCSSLASVYLLSTAMVTLGTSVFTGAYRSISIFVRSSLLETYLADASWATYSAKLVGMTDEEIETLKTELGV